MVYKSSNVTISPENTNWGASDEGADEADKIGGAYKNVPANGGQVHHMPADSINPYSKSEGPGIRMETRDHMDTESWGSSKKAKQYRQSQKGLINQGKFEEAQQMLDYTKELLSKNKMEVRIWNFQ